MYKSDWEIVELSFEEKQLFKPLDAVMRLASIPLCFAFFFLLRYKAVLPSVLCFSKKPTAISSGLLLVGNRVSVLGFGYASAYMLHILSISIGMFFPFYRKLTRELSYHFSWSMKRIERWLAVSLNSWLLFEGMANGDLQFNCGSLQKTCLILFLMFSTVLCEWISDLSFETSGIEMREIILFFEIFPRQEMIFFIALIFLLSKVSFSFSLNIPTEKTVLKEHEMKVSVFPIVHGSSILLLFALMFLGITDARVYFALWMLETIFLVQCSNVLELVSLFYSSQAFLKVAGRVLHPGEASMVLVPLVALSAVGNLVLFACMNAFLSPRNVIETLMLSYSIRSLFGVVRDAIVYLMLSLL